MNLKQPKKKSVVQESKQWEQVSGEAGTGGSWCETPSSSQWLHRWFTERNAMRDIVKKSLLLCIMQNFGVWCVLCVCLWYTNEGVGVCTHAHTLGGQNRTWGAFLYCSDFSLNWKLWLGWLPWELMGVCLGSSAGITGLVQPCTAWNVYFKILIVLRLWGIIKK